MVCLYHGDAREILPSIDPLGILFAAAIVDPPYGASDLVWDRWVDGWPALLAPLVPTFWCFGSLRMFLDRHDDFAGWQHAQEVVWEKHNGSSTAADRFKRVHELAVQFYRGPWADLYHDVPTTPEATARQVRRKEKPAHWGAIAGQAFRSEDGGPRLMRSVQYVRSEHGRALHPTQKPTGILEPLIAYSVPAGCGVLDPFAGAASTLIAARNIGRRAVGIEADERYVELAIRRLRVGTFPLERSEGQR
jgi:site-specific DNA-methyltransferase (adenine-specific)